MVESIEELRMMCQDTRDNLFYRMPWIERNIYRRISVYFTWSFLKLGISANQATLANIFVGLGAGSLLSFANPLSWLLGMFLFYFYMIFDCVDGEIARYRHSASAGGTYLDSFSSWVIHPVILACMSFGLYSSTGNSLVFALGFVAVIGYTLYEATALLPYYVLHERKLLSKAIRQLKFDKPTTIEEYGSVVFGSRGFAILVPVTAVADCFAASFSVGPFRLNVRLIYFTALALSRIVGVVVRGYGAVERGVRLSRL